MRKRWSRKMPRCRRCERQFCLLLTDWPYHRLGGARCTPLVLTTSASAVRTKVRISFSAPLSTRVLVASISLSPAFSFSTSTHNQYEYTSQKCNCSSLPYGLHLTCTLYSTCDFLLLLKPLSYPFFLLLLISCVLLPRLLLLPILLSLLILLGHSLSLPQRNKFIDKLAFIAQFYYIAIDKSLFCSYFQNEISSFISNLAQCVYDARTVHASRTREPAPPRERNWMTFKMAERETYAHSFNVYTITYTHTHICESSQNWSCEKYSNQYSFLLKVYIILLFLSLSLIFFCFLYVFISFRFHSFFNTDFLIIHTFEINNSVSF